MTWDPRTEPRAINPVIDCWVCGMVGGLWIDHVCPPGKELVGLKNLIDGTIERDLGV